MSSILGLVVTRSTINARIAKSNPTARIGVAATSVFAMAEIARATKSFKSEDSTEHGGAAEAQRRPVR
ncbi:hypothetical protein [Dongia sp.]|uniref:hypothetical protein n=1 Tax=Dongia sp. TaxID=1977262 RepID=UPI0035B38BB3